MVVLGDNGVLNVLLRTIGLIREPIKLMFTQFAVLVGLIHVELPFMVLSILAALERIDPAMSEAAETLGASRWRTIWHVVLPLAVPGIVAGTTLVFSLSISAFVTPALMGGTGTRVLTTLIYQQFVMAFNWPFGSAIAAVLLLVAVGIIFLYLRVMSRRATGALQAG
jgi:putative spermidine/putrescine transport system permease protein